MTQPERLLTGLYSIMNRLAYTSPDTIRDDLRASLRTMFDTLQAEDGAVTVIDPMTDKLHTFTAPGQENDASTPQAHPAVPVAEWLIHNEKLATLNLKETAITGTGSWERALAIVLETNEDVQGALVLFSNDPNAFPPEHVEWALAVSQQMALAMNTADLYTLLRDMAERLGAAWQALESMTEE